MNTTLVKLFNLYFKLPLMTAVGVYIGIEWSTAFVGLVYSNVTPENAPAHRLSRVTIALLGGVLIEEFIKISILKIGGNLSSKSAIMVGFYFGFFETIVKINYLTNEIGLLTGFFLLIFRLITTSMHILTTYICYRALIAKNWSMMVFFFVVAVAVHFVFNMVVTGQLR